MGGTRRRVQAVGMRAIRFLALLLFIASSAQAGWFDAAWSYRQALVQDHTKVPNNDQVDFKCYLDLNNMSSGFFSHVKSDGGDIVVTTSDGTTQVPLEVVYVNTGGSKGEIHFKCTLSHVSDTTFYVYYGNSGASQPSASSTYGSQNVWNGSITYRGVWHLKDGNTLHFASVTWQNEPFDD